MKRTNTAKWVESAQRWQINVQKDGKRKTFTSTKPGRTGQREANAKADAWLDEGLVSRKVKVCDAWAEFFARMQKTTGKSNWRPIDGRWRTSLHLLHEKERCIECCGALFICEYTL